MAFRGWREQPCMSVPIGNAGSVVPAASARPSLASYGPSLVPALLPVLTAGLVQQEGSARLTKKEKKRKKRKKPALSKTPQTQVFSQLTSMRAAAAARQRQERVYGRDGTRSPRSDGFKSLWSCLLPSPGVRK